MIGVILNPEQPRKGTGELPPYAAAYITEILHHAGIPFSLLPQEALAGDSPLPRLLILAQDFELDSEQKAGLAEFVHAGGLLIGNAGTSGMDDLFGVQTIRLLEEGYLQPPAAAHPVTGGLSRETHIFGGTLVKAVAGTGLAQVESILPPPQEGVPAADAVITHAPGRGRTILFALDLITSVLHIHQGKPVVPIPPRESSGTLAGSILDPDRDGDIVDIDDIDDLYYSSSIPLQDGRTYYHQRIILSPMADVLRELLLRAIFHLLSAAGESLPLLWYWPRGHTSMAHMSHDTDGNRPLLGWSLFDLLQELNVPSTWCTMPVAGYDRSFYKALIESTSEIALHYATGNAPVREAPRWSQMDFDWQYDTLSYETGLSNIVSNKNHGIAWQGRLEFYYWCQNKGIQLEHSRGDRGFTFGTCHPWFPMEDDRPHGDFLDVIALPFLIQDFTVVCPQGFMRPLVDQCHAAYGCAHVLYHPSHVEDPECERSIRETVAHARSLGMEWWTSEEINSWERSRRRVSISHPGNGASTHEGSYRIQSQDSLNEATLLYLLPANGAPASSFALDGKAVDAPTVERYGHRFAQITADLSGEHELKSTLGDG
ncbi:MAG: hypothetical protein OXI80_07190 [Caldilineaceae bacterium]|nr:hypothetical protein [Caldilineaceae bacterium]MDE0337437.1 hypothetical protein [Caldilineaceae bacterium]